MSNNFMEITWLSFQIYFTDETFPCVDFFLLIRLSKDTLCIHTKLDDIPQLE